MPSLLREPPLKYFRWTWDRLAALPGGKRAFDRLVGALIPYTGSIHPRFHDLRTGYARVSLRDRRALHNHIRSIHAVALANLAELTGNAAVAYSMPGGTRFIVKSLAIEYLKKAHGTITATAHCPLPITTEKREYEVSVELRDATGTVVARATLRTLVGPTKA